MIDLSPLVWLLIFLALIVLLFLYGQARLRAREYRRGIKKFAILNEHLEKLRDIMLSESDRWPMYARPVLFTQIDREMTEELGISSGAIAAHHLLGIVEDEANNVVEAVIETKLTCSFAEVRQSHARIERPEYSELFALTTSELAAAIARGSDPISAVSRTIFALAIQEA